MNNPSVRHAAVAGLFYPGSGDALERLLVDLLGQLPESGSNQPKALIVPHAGYIYSGLTAAFAYRKIFPFRKVIRNVVILGPAHRVHFRGAATTTLGYFETPVGRVKINRDIVDDLNTAFDNVASLDEAHREEHCIEVQLPFLQHVLDKFTLVPILTGDITQTQTAEILNYLWDQKDTIFLVSTDLSHFENYTAARKLDAETAAFIENFEYKKLSGHSACGGTSLGGLLVLAKEKNLRIQRLDMRNSGDTGGGKQSVVGYGSWALFEQDEKGYNA